MPSSTTKTISKITIDHEADVQVIKHEEVEAPYPRQLVIDFGRPGQRIGLSMRELIHWTAYRLDACDDDKIDNHRLAVVLRAIADEFYPYLDDYADYLAEDLADAGDVSDFDFEDVKPAPVDVRLFNLADGYAKCDATFNEMIWDDEEPTAALARSAESFLRVDFPSAILERFNIRGLQLYTVDLVHFIRSHMEWMEMAFQDQEAWLDALSLTQARAKANRDYRSDVKRRARFGDAKVDSPDTAFSPGSSAADAEAILAELSGLV